MAEIDFTKTLGKTTWNSNQWAEAIQKYVVDRPYEDMAATVLAKSIEKIKLVLMANLTAAIDKPAGGHGEGEFSTDVLRGPLIRAFSREGMVQIMDDEVDLLEGAFQFAGTEQDWQDGIVAARKELQLGGGDFTKRQRADFWRDFIYGPARIGMDPNLYVEEDDDAEKKRLAAIKMYDRTIEARLEKWGGLVEEEGGAPYWIILEHGNADSTLAFPRFRGTNFLEHSRKEGQKIFDQTKLDVENQVENIIFREVEKFLENPDSYKPYDALAIFYAEGKRYFVYVTKYKRIGTTLRIRRGR